MNQIHDVMLVCKSLEGQLELLILVDAASAELRLSAVVEQTAAQIAQSKLDQVSEIIGSKPPLALNLVFVALLSRRLI